MNAAPQRPPVKRRPRRRRRKSRLARWGRDSFFFVAAVTTYFHEFWMGDQEPSLLGFFGIFLFLGFIPAFRMDDRALTLGDAQGILIRLLGGQPPGGKPPES